MKLSRCLDLLVVAFAVQPGQAINNDPPPPKKLAGFEYIASGYNIVRGNPLSEQVGCDPGFRTQQIFQISYNDQKHSSDDQYLVPDNTSFWPAVSCTLDFETDVQSSMSNFSSLLRRAAQADFSGWGAAFSANADYQSAEDCIERKMERTVSAVSKCSTYNGAINMPLHPALSAGFNTQVNALDRSSPPKDWEPYYDMIDFFGTHYMSEVLMGASYGEISSVTKESWKELESKGVTVQMAAKYHGWVSAGTSGMTQDQTEAAQQFETSVSKTSTISCGSRPPAGDNRSAVEWEQQVFDSPMPISYSLRPISELLPDLSLQSNMAQALMQYCTQRVAKQSPEVSCSPPEEKDCMWNMDCQSGQQCVKGLCQGKVVPLDGTWTGIERRLMDGSISTCPHPVFTITGDTGTQQSCDNTFDFRADMLYDGTSFIGTATSGPSAKVTFSATSMSTAVAVWMQGDSFGWYYNLSKVSSDVIIDGKVWPSLGVVI